MSQIKYRKESVIGYTGHVPTKKQIYGMSVGDINKRITGSAYKPSNFDVDIDSSNDYVAKRDFYMNAPPKDIEAQ